jgi:hypothetical protein
MSDALQIVGCLADAGWMIPLPIAQHAMAVATDGGHLSIEGFARDVVKLQGQGIVEAAKWTSRIICPKALERPLSAALSVQFK